MLLPVNSTISVNPELLRPDLLAWFGDAAGALVPILPALLAATYFATLREALQRSVATRVLGNGSDPEARDRLAPLLARAGTLATSAGVFEVASRAAIVILVYGALLAGAGLPPIWRALAAIGIALPVILLFCEALPAALAVRRGDALLRSTLLTFYAFQLPLRWLVAAFEAVRGALLRVVGLEKDPAASRQIVEGLREVIEGAELSGDLDETEREIIGNVIEFREASVSMVMTPRTEVFGVEVQEGLVGAAHVLAECGHSRLPVYEGSLDVILGTVSARDVVEAAAEGRLDKASLRSVIRPAYFVPETKTVRELLAEFRREKIKLAIVLDEYGGTAGIVTLGDIVQEIVGDIQDEDDGDALQRVRRLSDGTVEVDAALHVSEVNEELGTDIAEGEDYETLAGFVLSELGHIPKRGEAFSREGISFRVLEATDRRVLKVGVRPPATRRAS